MQTGYAEGQQKGIINFCRHLKVIKTHFFLNSIEYRTRNTNMFEHFEQNTYKHSIKYIESAKKKLHTYINLQNVFRHFQFSQFFTTIRIHIPQENRIQIQIDFLIPIKY